MACILAFKTVVSKQQNNVKGMHSGEYFATKTITLRELMIIIDPGGLAILLEIETCEWVAVWT